MFPHADHRRHFHLTVSTVGWLLVCLMGMTGCAQSRWRQDPALTDWHGSELDPHARHSNNPTTVVRYQQDPYATVATNPYQNNYANPYQPTAGAEDLPRQRMAVSGNTAGTPATNYSTTTSPTGNGSVQPVQYTYPQTNGQPIWGAPAATSPYPTTPGVGGIPTNTNGALPPGATNASPYATSPTYTGPLPPPPAPAPTWPGGPVVVGPQVGPPPFVGNIDPSYGAAPGFPTPLFGPNDRFADVIVNLQETHTGRLMIGAAVNSDAGLTGQIIVDERNFDWRQVPTSWDDVLSGRAFRGGGQTFRLEALPGNQFQRYSVTFAEPFFLNTRVSLDLAGYYFDRSYFDWNEGRVGGKVGLGYRLTPDLSFSTSLRGEQVDISDPRIPGVPELDAALGEHDVFGAKFAVAHDTRDLPFSPTQGHYFEASYEQVFGSFDYPRGMLDWRRYFLVMERPDGSGRHVLGFSNRVGITGSQTPIYDNFYAGGFSTMRGFNLRGAAPVSGGVVVGGELLFLGSVEYLFPITADDMLKGVLFVDYGTVEEEIKIEADDYRVALGFGLRINIPAMGPAPIAVDFAVPVAREDTDNIQNVSFNVGISR